MAENIQRARALFLHAVGSLPPEEWDGYIEGECRGDTELQRLAMRFLSIHRQAGSFLESPAIAVDADEMCPGEHVGPYQLLEQIGEGGMGTVWMAEQKEPIQRRVAVKVIKAGMDSKQVLARFEAERQALALMEHPNIARVLDAGVTGAGRPYFVMELVKGTPITQYCEDKHLPERER
jgi:serine/threonine protein kinase